MIEQFALPIVKFLLDNKLFVLFVFAIIVFSRMWWHKSLLSPGLNIFSKTRQEAKQAILEERWGKRYVHALKWLNQELAGWIGDADRFADSHTLHQHLTVESYEFCLKLAFLYPILAFFAAWAMGGDGRLGGLAVLDADMPDWQRGLSFAALLVTMGLAVWNARLSGWKSSVVLLLAFAFAGAGAFAVAVAATFAVATTFAVAGAFAAVTIAGGAVAGAFVFVFAVAVVYAGDGAIAGAFAFTVAAALPVAVAIEWLHKKSAEPSLSAFFWLAYGVLLGILALIILSFTDKPTAQLILLFYLLLPLLNAPIDWLSLGFTRYLLYRLESERGWLHVLLWGLADLVVALLFLALISGVLVSALVLANAVAAKPLVDLNVVFAGLRDDNHMNDVWIYFILLSTLIPTLVHFSLIGGALTRLAPQGWRERIVQRMDTHEGANNFAWLYISIVPALGYVLAPGVLLSVLFWLLTTHGGVIGFALLDAAEAWAVWLGG